MLVMKTLRLLLCGLALPAANLLAATEGGEAGHGSDHLTNFLFALISILVAAKLGGELFERFNQPAVLGELVFGMILGNLHLVGFYGLEWFKHDEMLAITAEIGVILLLFEVGLESNIKELVAVGSSAMLVAILGVVAPVILGYGVSTYFLPAEAWYVHLFAGATLAATSVGITARVLKDMGKMNTKEAKIILGAAVVDDVLGLIILAVVAGLVQSIDAGGSAEVSYSAVGIIVGKSVAFLAVAVVAGQMLAGKVIEFGTRFRVSGIPVVLSLCYCFLMAALAGKVGLAPIVGAFAAGLVLDNTHFRRYHSMKEMEIEELLAPLSAVYVPVFFVLMGIQVDLTAFSSMSVIQFAIGLSVAAIIGKQVCSLGVLEKGLNKVAIGVGMIPRGEVGLIFASIGASLSVAGKPVFGSETLSAMVVMVMVTTLATPPILKAMFSKT